MTVPMFLTSSFRPLIPVLLYRTDGRPSSDFWADTGWRYRLIIFFKSNQIKSNRKAFAGSISKDRMRENETST